MKKCLQCKEEFETQEAKDRHHRDNLDHAVYEDKLLKLTGKLFLRGWEKKTPEEKDQVIKKTLRKVIRGK